MPEHTNVMRPIYIDVQQEPPFQQIPVSRWKTSRSFPEQLHGRRGFLEAGFHLATPEHAFHANTLSQCGLLLQLQPMGEGDVLATPVLLETLRAAKINARPFA